MYFCDKTQMMKKILSFIILFSISMLLKSQTGNVGVNTISPTHTLDVNGTFRVRKITQVGSSQSAKDSIMVFDEDGVVKYVSANAVVAEATAGNAKVLTNSTLTGNGSTGNELGIAQQGATTGQVLTWNGTTWVPQAAAPVSTTNTISTSGNTITSNVNGVSSTAPSITSNNLNLTGNNLSTSVNGVASSNVDLTPYLDNTDNQNLSITGNNLSISGGNSVTLPSADGSETKVNAGTNISVTGSGTIASPYVINNTFTEIDGSTTNEIQTLNLSANTLSLSNGGGSVTLSGGTVTNVSGTAPISVVNGTTTPVISLIRNNLNTATSSNVATSPLTVTNGANAVVNGADTSLAVNNTAPLWNANQLQGRNIASTAPNNNQVLSYNSTTTQWEPRTNSAWDILGNSGTNPTTNFLGTTDGNDFVFRTNNVEKARLFSLANPSFGIGRTTLAGVNGGASSFSGPTVFLGNAGNFSSSTGFDFIIDDDNNATNSQFIFKANGDGAAGTTELMQINENGNVGIGITSGTASAKLHTVGTVRMEGLATTTTNTNILTTDTNGNVATRTVGSLVGSTVLGTAPIEATPSANDVTLSLTRNNLNTGTSSNTATAALVVNNGANAVVNGSDTSLTINNTAPLWNANQLQGVNVSATAPTNGQILKYNGTQWLPSVEAAASNWLITGNSNTTSSNFLGTTNDVLMSIRSNNTSMLEVGRRATLGLTVTSGGSNIFPYNDANNYLVHVKGNSGVSALQFEAGAASFYKPIFFTDTNGNFTLRGSSAGTDFFELGSSGTSNNGQLQFTVGDDGDEPIIFYRDRFDRTPRLREMLRMQGTGNNDNIRVGVNMNGSVANSTLQVNGSVSASILSVSSAITLDETHYTIILTNNSAITLPAASTCKGRIYIIKKTATGTATISAYLNSVGTSSTTITNGVLQLQSDGTSWQQIN